MLMFKISEISHFLNRIKTRFSIMSKPSPPIAMGVGLKRLFKC